MLAGLEQLTALPTIAWLYRSWLHLCPPFKCSSYLLQRSPLTREQLEVEIELTIGDRDRGCLLESGGGCQFWT